MASYAYQVGVWAPALFLNDLTNSTTVLLGLVLWTVDALVVGQGTRGILRRLTSILADIQMQLGLGSKPMGDDFFRPFIHCQRRSIRVQKMGSQLTVNQARKQQTVGGRGSSPIFRLSPSQLGHS
jgi:hypothetical protein